jgi:hypothetical protein
MLHKKEFGQAYCKDLLKRILRTFISYFLEIYSIHQRSGSSSRGRRRWWPAAFGQRGGGHWSVVVQEVSCGTVEEGGAWEVAGIKERWAAGEAHRRRRMAALQSKNRWWAVHSGGRRRSSRSLRHGGVTRKVKCHANRREAAVAGARRRGEFGSGGSFLANSSAVECLRWKGQREEGCLAMLFEPKNWGGWRGP